MRQIIYVQDGIDGCDITTLINALGICDWRSCAWININVTGKKIS